MYEFKVTVTKNNILNGDRYSPFSCPVALAIKDLGFSQNNFHIFWDECIFSGVDENEEFICKFPKAVRTFIMDFDNINCQNPKYIKPIKFKIKLPINKLTKKLHKKLYG